VLVILSPSGAILFILLNSTDHYHYHYLAPAWPFERFQDYKDFEKISPDSDYSFAALHRQLVIIPLSVQRCSAWPWSFQCPLVVEGDRRFSIGFPAPSVFHQKPYDLSKSAVNMIRMFAYLIGYTPIWFE
jgi:hypothetical protein